MREEQLAELFRLRHEAENFRLMRREIVALRLREKYLEERVHEQALVIQRLQKRK